MRSVEDQKGKKWRSLQDKNRTKDSTTDVVKVTWYRVSQQTREGEAGLLLELADGQLVLALALSGRLLDLIVGLGLALELGDGERNGRGEGDGGRAGEGAESTGEEAESSSRGFPSRSGRTEERLALRSQSHQAHWPLKSASRK